MRQSPNWVECQDFLAECSELNEMLLPQANQFFAMGTGFKCWTVNDILGHLNFWNSLAEQALLTPAEFAETAERLIVVAQRGDLLATEQAARGSVAGKQLLEKWSRGAIRLAGVYAAVSPNTRVAWIGPSMSARSKIVARQMETWAHGQAIYDLLGATRKVSRRIRNIANLGVKTFAWTFSNRGLAVPGPQPFVSLTGPDGETWEWGDVSEEERVEGRAEEFCQVVTQVRHVADTGLRTTGNVSRRWLQMAQCFAGPPEDPPAPGTRIRKCS